MLDAWVASRLGAAAPLTAEALARRQLEALNAVLAYARASSPFYRTRLPEGELASLDGLSRLPFTTPEDLRQSGRLMLCVKGDEISRIVTLLTSGSTGPSKRVYFTADDQERTVDFFHHGMASLIRPGDKVLLLFPGESPGSLNDLLITGLRRMGAEGIPFGYPTEARYDELLNAILRHKAASLVGPASAVAGAAERSLRQSRAAEIGSVLESVLLAAEYVSPQNRAVIQDAWRCTVNEQYGMTETGFLGPVSCAIHDGYHIPAADLYCEIVHPDTGCPLPPGEEGEVVFTTLSRRGMPLIRYRTGDRSRLLAEPCPCGSVLPRLARVQSRPDRKKFQRPEPISL